MTRTIQDRCGRVIGRVDERDDKTVYLTKEGRVVAYVHDDRTYRAGGQFVGYGDQGQFVLAEEQ